MFKNSPGGSPSQRLKSKDFNNPYVQEQAHYNEIKRTQVVQKIEQKPYEEAAKPVVVNIDPFEQRDFSSARFIKRSELGKKQVKDISPAMIHN